MKKVRKAIIPAAGLGTRMLPISHAVPKEMLPIVDLPAVYYLVEEAVNSGITDILIITNRGKDAMEDFFDLPIEYMNVLEAKGKVEEARRIREIANMANIFFLRQKETGGLGHAVLCAKSFVGDEPFAILYGDDVIISEKPVTQQLIDAYEKYSKGAVGVSAVSDEDVMKYCSLAVNPLDGNCYDCYDMIEKPKKEEIMSNFSILGRVIMPPEIFDILENTEKGAGGELQLTDAMKTLAQKEGVIAVDYEGTRYDMGNKLGILKANIEVGLKHPEIKDGLREYLKNLDF